MLRLLDADLVCTRIFDVADTINLEACRALIARGGAEIRRLSLRREGSDLSEEDVREFCRGRLAHNKVPRHVRFCTEYPMTVTGKVQKNKLRELAAEGLAPHAAN